MGDVETLAAWSAWVPFGEALASAPMDPGVYMAREGEDGPIIYVGMAGERRGKGISGRLRVYASGKALTSGLGEAVADRAFADAGWLHERLAEVEGGNPRRAIEWGRLAFERANLYVRWSTTVDRHSAKALEDACGGVLEAGGLWNRRRFLSG
jgi:hypothetical protein